MAEQQATPGHEVVAKVRERLLAQQERVTGQRQEQGVAEESPPRADVSPESSPGQDVAPESSPDAQEQRPTKDVNFKRLREERDRERRLRENLELELAEARRKQREQEEKAKNDDRFQQVWQQIQGERPDDFEEWDANKQSAWTARQLMLQGLDKDLGIAKDLRKIHDENKILRKFPSLDDDQMQTVMDVYQSAAGVLSEAEAYEIAKRREPELFAAPAPTQAAAPAEGAMPPSNGVIPPSRDGAHRAAPDEEGELRGRMNEAFADSPAFMHAGKMETYRQLMKHRLAQRGLLPG